MCSIPIALNNIFIQVIKHLQRLALDFKRYFR